MKINKTGIRKLLLKIPNFYIDSSIDLSTHLMERNSRVSIWLSTRCLLVAELLNLLNLPKSILKKLLQVKTFSILVYMFVSISIFSRFGNNFLELQLRVSIEFDIFEEFRKRKITSMEPDDFVVDWRANNLSLEDIKYNIEIFLTLTPANLIQHFSNLMLSNPGKAPIDIQEVGSSVANLLHAKGYFLLAEKIETTAKIALDKKLGRNIGLRNESTYLTAIGHIALLGFLIMGKKVGLVDDCPISIVRDESAISNSLFADLVISKSLKLGIEILNHPTFGQKEGDLELYPSQGSYKIARDMYKSIFLEYEKRYSNPLLKFSDLNTETVAIAEKILTEHGVPIDSKLIGVHCREDQNLNRANRNSVFKKFKETINYLEVEGFTVIRLGHSNRHKRSPRIGKRSIDSTLISITKEETEALDLYVWSRAEFFLGNLSGGTFPPALFGVPTIYFDVFPLTHYVPPGALDRILPKKLYSIKDQSLLRLEMVFDPAFTYLQTENRLKLHTFGYSLVENTSLEILESVQNLILKLRTRNAHLDNNQILEGHLPLSRFSHFERTLSTPY